MGIGVVRHRPAMAEVHPDGIGVDVAGVVGPEMEWSKVVWVQIFALAFGTVIHHNA